MAIMYVFSLTVKQAVARLSTMEGHDSDPGTSPRAIAEIFRVASGGDVEKVNVLDG